MKRRLMSAASRLSALLAQRHAGSWLESWKRPERPAPGTLADYRQPPAGAVERAIDLCPVAAAGAARSSHAALSPLAVRDFGGGLAAFERLVAHVLENKLGARRRGGFWYDTVVVPVRCELRHRRSGRSFDVLRPSSTADIDGELAESEPARVAESERYARALASGDELGPPVYASGLVLGEAAGRPVAEPRDLYMLDGARRITAAALAHRPSLEVLCILHESQLCDLLPAAELAAIRERLAALRWFDRYQSLPWLGLEGERSLARFRLMDLGRLRDATVLDFGCNVGAASIKAAQVGARRVVGVEGMADTFALARDIGRLVGFDNLDYLEVNFNDADFDARIDAALPGQVDYSFFFSVYRTKELTQRERLFRYILDKTRRGVFFEGHAHAEIDTIAYYDWLFDCFGVPYRFLGHSEGRLRPLFYLDRESR